MLLRIFDATPLTFSDGRPTGYIYEALKDQLKWHNMSRKEYVPVLLGMFSYFIKGLNSK